MTDEFKKDIRELCGKYGGLQGVIERLADLERETSFKMIESDPEAAKFYALMAYKLMELRDLWVSR